MKADKHPPTPRTLPAASAEGSRQPRAAVPRASERATLLPSTGFGSADRCFNVFAPRFWLGDLDLRPLGFMRIAFGLTLLWSTVDLAPVLFDFFSDGGVVPRSALLGSLARQNRVSVFDIAGPNWLLAVLFALLLLSVAAFAVGWHTRLATVAAYFLVCGLHERNTQVFDGSDNVLRVLLFWLMFMPSGARYSLDAVLAGARGRPLRTHAPALPIRLGQLQIAWVYLNTVVHKWPGVEWHNGSALRIALGLDHLFTRSLGHLMFNQRWFIALGTHATVVIEAAFLPLVFLPFWKPSQGLLSRWPAWLFQPTWKALAIAGGTSLHLGIALLMSVGNFSYIMISSYFLLYEPEWIEAIWRALDLRQLWGREVTKVLYDGECAVCRHWAGTARGLDFYRRLELVNYRDAAAMSGLGFAQQSFDRPFYAVGPGGSLHAGYHAWNRIAQRLPALFALGYLGGTPGVKGLASPLFSAVERRHQTLLALAPDRSALRRQLETLLPEWLRQGATYALWTVLAGLMAFCMWFSFPEVAKIPALKWHGRDLSQPIDVSPSKMPYQIHDAIQELELWQKWDMFSPKPLDHDAFLMGRGELTDGTQVDVVRGDRGNHLPPLVPPIHPRWFFNRWTKYINNLLYETDNSPWSLEFGRFVCRSWNNNAPAGRAQLKTFKLFREEQKVPLFDEKPEEWHEQLIWDHHCF